MHTKGNKYLNEKNIIIKIRKSEIEFKKLKYNSILFIIVNDC